MNYKMLKAKSDYSVEDLDEKGIVKIRVSAFGNVDSHGDIMDQKAFNKTISDFNGGGRTRLKHLLNHSWNDVLGYPMEMKATSEGLEVTSRINLKTSIGKDTFENYKFFAEGGQTLEHSIGYVTVKEEYSEKQNANILKEVNMMEYSTISFLGSNGETPLLGLKDNEMKQDELIKRIEDLEARLKALEPSENTQAVKVEESKPAIDVNVLKTLKLN